MALRVLFSSGSVKQFFRTIDNGFIVKCSMSSSPCDQGSSGQGTKNVGFVGLGNMGCQMAKNLIKKGHKLHVFDVSKTACEDLRYNGATIYENTQELAQQSEFVITMLPNNQIVQDAYLLMVTDNVRKDTTFIDSSTIDPRVAQAVQKHVKSKGASFVDAPVSGGVPGAQAATLTFMVGGTKEEFERVKPVLEGMGRKITHCGDYGMGQAAKLCNNMLLGISMIGVAESMNLAIRLGLDPKLFMDIVNSSTGRCWSSETYNPVPGLVSTAPASKGYKGGFSCDLITKDLSLASGIATASNTPIPMGAMAHQIYRTLKAKGLGSKDFSVIYEFLKNEKNK